VTSFRNTTNTKTRVGTVTGYGLDDRGVGVRVAVGLRIFTSPSRPDRLRLWGPPNLLFNGYRGSVLEVKRPGSEAHHSPPTVLRSRKRGSIYPLPHTPSWRCAYVVKHRKFMFTGHRPTTGKTLRYTGYE
jgi:hypothetical protein